MTQSYFSIVGRLTKILKHKSYWSACWVRTVVSSNVLFYIWFLSFLFILLFFFQQLNSLHFEKCQRNYSGYKTWIESSVCLFWATVETWWCNMVDSVDVLLCTYRPRSKVTIPIFIISHWNIHMNIHEKILLMLHSHRFRQMANSKLDQEEASEQDSKISWVGERVSSTVS